MTSSRSFFMQTAIDLAKKGKGKVHPNPIVGCVIVKGGKIVGKGAHTTFGGPHAEVVALKKAGKKARGASAYITLEPCAHWGKTAPCAPALVNSGIKTVFVAMKDPNPRVSGRGIKRLKKAKIQVHVGLKEAESKALNPAFITWMTQKRPYVILKTAMTLDGKIASRSGHSKWITSLPARKLAYELRAQSDAVLIGANTAIQDDPHLTSHGRGKNPVRIVLDPKLRTPNRLRIYNDGKAPTWVISGTKSSRKKANLLAKKGVQNLRMSLKFRNFELIKIIKNISKNNIGQLFVEGGGETAWTFIKAGIVDEFFAFVAPIIIGGRDAKSPVEGDGFKSVKHGLTFSKIETKPLGRDFMIHAIRRTL